MIRHSNITSESWKSLPWKKFRKNLFRLQKRIFKAIKVDDIAKAKSLQKLVLKSTSAKLIAIRQVTQLNKGRKTAGIDGKKALNFKERFELLKSLSRANDWKHQGLREVPIPKKNGKTRILKVPTISDRAWQCLVKYALEPAHEATFHARSYGFRTGRSTQDAQKIIFNNLRSISNGQNKIVIELDIKKCFDRISHKSIMERLIASSAVKLGIFRCLKAGINPEFPEQGTPQGGIVSPLLANIALNGIEEIHSSVRYADDMIIFLKPNEDADKVLKKVTGFLKERGMELSEEKTKVTATTDGFNFLGWNFKVQSNGKFRSTPSEENFKAMREKVKTIVNNSNYGAEVKASKLAPIIRGWRNYHRHCDMSNVRDSLWHISHRTFKVFLKQKKTNRYMAESLVKKAFPTVSYSENRFVNVKGEKSPFDGDLIYWSQRESKLYDGTSAKLLKKQNHTCARCNMKILPGEDIHLHHIDGNHDNWKTKNLEMIHQSCHQYTHMSKSES
ncbi:group II intron reverse transcriptase/maturase [Rivularia sp. UHCC 0363]|uniref:group II intron reverse transcriptase/maturase n=1 Tax=Rivularia sp. UHCC 0363 TaxID=3110244 RepID=UPI002B2141AA|nr:group II intron reverse transcriptase/maturase [Rivularia sp. UHCC 0363]MEA5597059.1 group II intron reverse transcriptase/maturase [Rivularia sp. UHCC 0363]